MPDRSVTHATFTLERTFQAPPDRVFRAWSDPEVKGCLLYTSRCV